MHCCFLHNEKCAIQKGDCCQVTSLVAILNDQAVALAADSAVTTSGPYGQKIYNTVNKLFTLSKYHPVGIMVYSSAEVMTIPIETVIKTYRQRRGESCCQTLEDYHADFVSFLKDEGNLFPEEARIQHGIQVVFANMFQLRDRMMRRLTSEFPSWGEPKPVQVKQIARKMLQEHHDNYHASADLAGVSQSIRSKLRRELKQATDYWKNEYKATFRLSNADVASLSETTSDLLLRELRTGAETGFVIAGFGQDDYVPKLHSFELEASLLGVHKLRDGYSVDVSVTGAGIVPFAQSEMVETFVQGRESSLDRFLLQIIDGYFNDQKQALASNPAFQANIGAVHNLMDTLSDGLRQNFETGLANFTDKYHIGPVVNTVQAMPKEELAVMAEALVNLTSIKRRMSPDAETVGGPTDVAVISKGDGFVWIKRKHYFRPELNPTFGHNYFRGG